MSMYKCDGQRASYVIYSIRVHKVFLLKHYPKSLSRVLSKYSPLLKPSLGTSQPSQNPHLTQIAFPLSFSNLVSIRNITSGLNSRAFFLLFRTVEGLPKHLQFQLIILMAVAEAVWGQLPFAQLDL